MPLLMGYSSSPPELRELKAMAREAAARQESTAVWDGEFFSEAEAFVSRLKETADLDVCTLDIMQKGGVGMAEAVRGRFDDAAILLIVEPELSPREYLRPTIMASSLLMRPFTDREAYNAFCELMMLWKRHKAAAERAGEMFVIETKSGKQLLPYDRINYFEARERKIYICIDGREVGFYSTLDKLESMLPSQYMRCHKGYIVNCDRVERLAVSENLVYLAGGYAIPVSRSYKRALAGCFS